MTPHEKQHVEGLKNEGIEFEELDEKSRGELFFLKGLGGKYQHVKLNETMKERLCEDTNFDSKKNSKQHMVEKFIEKFVLVSGLSDERPKVSTGITDIVRDYLKDKDKRWFEKAELLKNKIQLHDVEVPLSNLLPLDFDTAKYPDLLCKLYSNSNEIKLGSEFEMESFYINRSFHYKIEHPLIFEKDDKTLFVLEGKIIPFIVSKQQCFESQSQRLPRPSDFYETDSSKLNLHWNSEKER